MTSFSSVYCLFNLSKICELLIRNVVSETDVLVDSLGYVCGVLCRRLLLRDSVRGSSRLSLIVILTGKLLDQFVKTDYCHTIEFCFNFTMSWPISCYPLRFATEPRIFAESLIAFGRLTFLYFLH